MSLFNSIRSVLCCCLILVTVACSSSSRLERETAIEVEKRLQAELPSLIRYAEISLASYVNPQEDPSCSSLRRSLPNMKCYAVPVQGMSRSHRAVYVIGSDQQSQVVAIRGTANFGDALIDLGTERVKDRDLEIEVHQGFLRVARAIFEDIKQNERLDRTRPIVLTGHSLGGAAAVLVGMLMAGDEAKQYDVHRIYTFGQPKIFGNEGATAWSVFNSRVFRVVNCGDPIPIVPVSERHLSNVVRIDFFSRNRLNDYQHLGNSLLLMDRGYFWIFGDNDFERDLSDLVGINLVDVVRGRPHQHQMALYREKLKNLESNGVPVRPSANIPCAPQGDVRIASR